MKNETSDIPGIPDVMDSKELAAYLKLSPTNGFRTIQRLARQGKIQGTRIGDLWRFTREQVLSIGKARP